MAAVWGRLHAEARSHVRAWAGLVLLVAIVGAAVMALVAGARRTDSAHARFLATHAASDLVIGDGAAFGFGRPADLDAIAHLPQVRDAAFMSYVLSGGQTPSGRTIRPGEIATITSPDGPLGRTIDRWKLLEGRRANPDRIDEGVAGFELARELDLGVGDTLHLRFVTQEALSRAATDYAANLPGRVAGRVPPPTSTFLEAAGGPPISVRVVGIEAAPFEFPPQAGNLPARLYLTRAFDEAFAKELTGQQLLSVRLRRGTDPAAFRGTVERMNPGTNVEFFGVAAENTANVQRSIHLQAVALAILAGLVAVAGAVAIAQALSRQAYVGSTDSTTLLALGLTRRQLIIIGAMRAGTVGLLGALIGAIAAIALSPLWPIGLARNAEPDPGVAIDWLVIAAGVLGLVVFAGLSGVIATSRWSSGAARRAQPTTLAPSAGGPFLFRIGVRQALGPGRGRNAVPMRSAILATGMAVATAVVAATFSANLDHLLATPRLYGWTHQAQLGSLGLPPVASLLVTGLRENRAVSGVSSGTVSEIEVERTRVTALALDDAVGSVPPDLLEGRSPHGDDEIVLGTETLDEIGARIGDRVRVGIGGAAIPMRVVGRAVFPEIGDNGQLGRGARTTFAALTSRVPGAAANVVQIKLTPGVDERSVLGSLRAAVDPLPLIEPEPPTDLATFGRVDELPIVTAAIMLLVAVAVLAHALATSVRRRRRDFAVLETLGCIPRQVAAIVAIQATTLALLALIIGIPLGVVVGRLTWRWVADALGVQAESSSILLVVLLFVPVLLLIANIVAAVPAWLAGRTRPAIALRAE